MRPQIIHFTTVHARTDTRIRLKQTATLARGLNADVSLYVQDGLGDDLGADGVRVVDTGPRPKGRVSRMTKSAWRMIRAVHAVRPTIAHFHDPELLPWAILLRLLGVRVIYDVHEDAPATVRAKAYLPALLRRPLAALVRVAERMADVACSAIVPATPRIAAGFGPQAVLVQNFPLRGELLVDTPVAYSGRPAHFAYVGGITAIRSAREMVEATAHVPHARLQMAGAFMPADLQAEITALPSWNRVDFHGWAGRNAVADILSRARAGLVLFHPLPNHARSQPNKLFEYMAAGLPVIASDFPLWREIIEGADCGLLVDPKDPADIAAAMQWILDHPDAAEVMGARGRRAVEEHYNWDAEGAKLVALYERLLHLPPRETQP
ncbi:glycosyltransferase [Roseovarius sp. LXJ103]|uniref:glycosyltransferase n=1 Tax=Roseovarius carneus TaxID=2853164 RepID=UPI000D61D496|nr:glycosyltransferase [Roseovarius carneus]MBZ8117580.1 glycosyltransferase [Roseovarius carneus]PWE36629.1 group 1 glycosyl transferase [Pelagicola sp. LXJ1103]